MMAGPFRKVGRTNSKIPRLDGASYREQKKKNLHYQN
jgi:hypothetical protein